VPLRRCVAGLRERVAALRQCVVPLRWCFAGLRKRVAALREHPAARQRVVGLRLVGAALGGRLVAPGQCLTVVVGIAERRQRIAEPGEGVAAVRAWSGVLCEPFALRRGRLAAWGQRLERRPLRHVVPVGR
jgi:hypothetical protein